MEKKKTLGLTLALALVVVILTPCLNLGYSSGQASLSDRMTLIDSSSGISLSYHKITSSEISDLKATLESTRKEPTTML